MSGVQTSQGSIIPTFCPWGLGLGDGCNGITINGVSYTPKADGLFLVNSEFPLGTIRFYEYATLLSGGVGSGQSWSGPHPWLWNSAGVDFPIGPSAAQALVDPSVTSIPNCTYHATGSTFAGHPELDCVNTGGDLTIANVEFGASATWGTTQCVILVVAQNQKSGSTVTLSGDDFQNGPGCLSGQAQASIANGVLTVTSVYYGTIALTNKVNIDANGTALVGTVNVTSGNTTGTSCNGSPCTGSGGTGTYGLSGAVTSSAQHMQFGSPIPQVFLIEGGSAGQSDYNLTVVNSQFDGHARPTDTVCGGVPCSDGGLSDGRKAGWRTVVYTSFLYMPSRPMSATGSSHDTVAGLNNGSDIAASYFEGFGLNSFGFHGEIIEDGAYFSNASPAGSTVPENMYDHIVVLSPSYNMDNTAIVYLSAGLVATPNTTWVQTDILNGVFISNITQPGNHTSSSTAIQVNRNIFTTINFTNNFLDGTGLPANSCIAQVTSPTITTTNFSGNKSLTSGTAISTYGTNC